MERAGGDQEGVEQGFGKTGAADNFLNLQRALRNVRSMLQQPNIARHQRRRDKTKYLPEGEVPRHDGQDRTNRKIAYKAALRSSLHNFVSQKFLSVLGI